MIVDAGGGDVGVAEPFLDLGDVGLVVERIGGGRRPQRMGAYLEAEIGRVTAHDLVDGVGRDGLFEAAGAVVLERAEQRAVLVLAVPGGLEVIVDELVRARVQWEIARLLALAGDLEMGDPAPGVSKIAGPQLAQLFAAERMIEERRRMARSRFSLMVSSPGFVGLFGISVMEGIIALSYFNTLIDAGVGRSAAVIRACQIRMRPVMMTCIAACVGLLPAAVSTGIGSQVQKPLALVVVGGIFLAPILILIVMPVLIDLFSRRKQPVGVPQRLPAPAE